MLLISCIWYLALLCHLVSLDMLCVNTTCLVSNYDICELCNAILFQDIIYVNYAMLSCCKGIIYVNYAMPCYLANYQPFEAVMEVSGLKTRYSEQTMLHAEANILLVTESSSEEDSETDDQSYFPPYCAYGVLHCYVI